MPMHKRYEFTVTVETEFVPEQSDEQQDRYVFSYTITVHNAGSVPAQLISRHWIITDANDEVQVEYTSGTVLATPVGTMRGSYQVTAEDGTQFEAAVPEFMLIAKRVLH